MHIYRVRSTYARFAGIKPNSKGSVRIDLFDYRHRLYSVNDEK